MNSEIHIYQNPDGNIKIDVRLDCKIGSFRLKNSTGTHLKIRSQTVSLTHPHPGVSLLRRFTPGYQNTVPHLRDWIRAGSN